MTNRQAFVCKCVLKYRNLNRILSKAKVSNYLELQNIIPPEYLTFSDINMDEHTEVELQGDFLAEYEERIRMLFDLRLAQVLSVLSLVISIIALLKP